LPCALLASHLFTAFVNGTTDQTVDRVASAMLQLYHVEEQKKKRWSEVEDLAKQLPNEHADLRPYLTRSNPIVNNYVENKLASAVVSGSSYPMEWYNLVPQKIDEIKSILFFYKNQQIQKKAREAYFAQLLQNKATELSAKLRLLVTPEELKEANPQTLDYFRISPNSDPKETVETLARFFETSHQLLLWFKQQLEGRPPQQQTILETTFQTHYKKRFANFYPRGMLNFITIHSKSLAIRAGLVSWVPS